MIVNVEPMSSGRSLLARRTADRRVTAASIGIAAMFVGLATLSALAPATMRMGWWLPLHLLLAGGAATAVAGVMPFFSAAVASVPPAPTSVRVVGVGGISLGALLVVLVRAAGSGAIDNGALGAVAGSTYLAGVAATGAATLLPLRSALGPRRAVLAVSYGAAITSVALGALIGTLAIAGWRPVLDAWDALRPTHAWLNVFGFLSLVIAASLLHLLPTVAGTRIERTRASTIVLVGLMAGPLVTAAGFVSRALPLAALGAALVVASGLALGRHAVTVTQRRGRWTTDPDWHRFVEWSLLAAVGWFIVGSLLAAGAVLGAGSVARGWDSALVLGPLALGWAGQSLVGSWSHLTPSVGPGSPETHARQRRVLGRWATGRVVLAEAGVALITIGTTGHQDQVTATGAFLITAYAALSVGLLGVALWPVLRNARSRVRLVASSRAP